MTTTTNRPAGDPRNWTPQQWDQYNAWEATQAEPPMWGPYEGAQQFYSSEEWLKIVRDSYDSHKVNLGVAKRIGWPEAIRFYERQIAACKQQLGIAPEAPPQLPLCFWETL